MTTSVVEVVASLVLDVTLVVDVSAAVLALVALAVVALVVLVVDVFDVVVAFLTVVAIGSL